MSLLAFLAALGVLDFNLAWKLGAALPCLLICIGAAVLTLDSSNHRTFLQPPCWVALSYILLALSDLSWYQPSASEVTKWIALGGLASFLMLCYTVWNPPRGRSLSSSARIAVIGCLSAVLSLGVFGSKSLLEEQRISEDLIHHQLVNGVSLLGTQIEAGQTWKALLEFPVPTEVGIYSSDGSLQFYQGSLEQRRELKEWGWKLPAPSGYLREPGVLVAWERLDNGLIILARHSFPSTLADPWALVSGVGLSLLVAMLFTLGASRSLSRSRKQSLDHLLSSAVRGEAEDPDGLDSDLKEVAQQIGALGLRATTLQELQQSFRLESAIRVVGEHLKRASDASEIRLWLNEAGRSFQVFGPEPKEDAGESLLEVPLVGREGRFGRVEFSFRASPRVQPYQLQQLVNGFAPLVDHLRRSQEQEVLADLLHRLLEPRLEDAAPLDVACKYLPSKLLSGDLLDVFPLGESTFGVVVADVLGKGSEAAATALRAKELIRLLCNQGLSPDEVASALNDRICASDSRMMTLFVARLDLASRELVYCGAGHEPALVLHQHGRVSLLEPTSMMIGVLPDGEFSEERLSLEGVERLLLFTDGVTETRDQDGKQFGEERVIQLFSRSRCAEHAVESLFLVTSLFGGGSFNDDLSVLSIDIPDTP